MQNKKNEEKQIIEGEFEEKWDPKKIAIGGIVIMLIIGGFFYIGVNKLTALNKGILGTFTRVPNVKEAKVSPQEDLTLLIFEAKKQVDSITPDNISSQAAELQKILDDIKAIQDKKKEPKDIICDYICKEK